jgi:phage antirepressor YoqD-like protein/biotin operon repressor
MGGNELSLFDKSEKTVTTKELSETLNVGESSIKRTVVKLRPVLGEVKTNRQGGYAFNEKQATLIKQEVQKHHNLANRQIDNITTELEENQTIANAMMILQRRNDELRQRAELAEESLQRLADAKGEKTVKEVAKILGYGEKNFFALMRGMGIFFYDNGINLPKQEYINSGYFFVKTENYPRNGEEFTYTRIYVTAKGLVWLEKKTKSVA